MKTFLRAALGTLIEVLLMLLTLFIAITAMIFVLPTEAHLLKNLLSFFIGIAIAVASRPVFDRLHDAYPSWSCYLSHGNLTHQ